MDEPTATRARELVTDPRWRWISGMHVRTELYGALYPEGGLSASTVLLYEVSDGFWRCGPVNAQQHDTMYERVRDLVPDLDHPLTAAYAERVAP
jgi:hypothetical protein